MMATYIGANLAWNWNNGPGVSNTQYQAFLQQFQTALAAVGLIQTADTGQLNAATATYPGTADTDTGYFVYTFADAAQVTNPIFIKFRFGAGNAYTSSIRLIMRVGTGSNGAGTLTGQQSSDFTICPQQPNGTSSGGNGGATGGHYACFKDGALFVGLMYGYGNYYGTTDFATSRAFSHAFSIERTRDPTSYALDGLGYNVWAQQGSSGASATLQGVRTASPAATYGASLQGMIIPGQPANTALLNGDKQLYPKWFNLPHPVPRWSSFNVRRTEFTSTITTFTAAPVAGQSRTFISPGQGPSGGYMVSNATGDGNFTPCFLWEP